MARNTAKPTAKVQDENDKIRCINCGTSNQNNFYQSKDKFHGHFGKIPYCKDCTKQIYDSYMQKYKNMNLAIYYTCRKLDIPYIHENYTGALENIKNPNSKIQGEDAIVSAYMKGLSFTEQNGWGYSFDDSIGENEIEGLSSFDIITKVKRKPINPNVDSDKYEIIEYDTDELQQKWGMFDNDDLAYLESEYLDWEEKLNGINEKSLDIFVKQVCLQCNEIRKDREQGINVDKKLKTLQGLLEDSGLVNKVGSGKETKSVGMTARDFEFKRPIKTVDPDFDDVDKIRDIIYGFTGAMCRALGTNNFYTEKFNEIYGKYSVDMINVIADKLKEEQEASGQKADEIIEAPVVESGDNNDGK